ncbi:dnaJ homolog subfamily C member 16 [Cotesia glomerata]|uniref:dnaJ homolog subfamily C member 16 n=1 Tax=Cotesia glomerata TaxID=32391 RepID=UPI001D0213BD|nr:dnaJ homolog subfamily C member 16 [Cotesia glomerata]XP_044593085.1 dnaJ homolog subfamily C member 16 [Cotesia glomerata]
MKNIVSFVRLPIFYSIIFIVVNILSIANASEPLRNPYEVLGVTRHVTSQEIRKAYKNLVKEWHPDKTDHPAAENKFVEITKAYELLADPERRKKFDDHGITEENMSRQKQSSNFHMNDPIDELFNSGNFKFHFQSRDVSFFHKMSISYRTYDNTIVPRSYRTPYLILFYYDWCFTCIQIEPTWRRLIDELEPIGVKLVTAHAERETSFARKVGVHSLPCLAVTLDGRSSVYKESLFNVNKIIEFVRSKFPYKLIQNINENNIDQFLSGWVDNRIRALIFEKLELPRLRYLLVAFHHRERVAFGYVQMGKPETEAIVTKYKIPKDLNTLLLFNENSEKPMASVSMKDISSETMHNVITNNNFLTLPRLSNQAMLDSVCPPEWLKPQKRLCAILVSQNSAVHDLARHKFRQAAIESPYSTERVRYTYIFKESQPEFVAALSASEGSPMEPLLHIVIIWRRDVNNLKYEWLKTRWIEPTQDENKWNESRQSLEQTIQRLLRTTEALPYAAKIEELADEHAQGTIDRIIGKALLAVDYISDNISKNQILLLISVITTFILIGAVTYGLSYLMKLEEISIQGKKGGYENNSRSTQVTSPLRLHELRAEKYNGLVRLLKPGCRTIILLIDHQSKLKLIPIFHKIIWPYRKNKTLLFSYMNMERGLNWYKKLLSLSLPELIELNINPKNCVGTVLALNGHRKYFCIYHAKHPECNKDKEFKRMERITKQMSHRSEDAEAGAFIGFDNSSDSEMSQDEIKNDVIKQDKLLEGLPNWLDRLFEGTTQRYHVNYWPDFTAK